jgi:hypothetical protein
MRGLRHFVIGKDEKFRDSENDYPLRDLELGRVLLNVYLAMMAKVRNGT